MAARVAFGCPAILGLSLAIAMPPMSPVAAASLLAAGQTRSGMPDLHVARAKVTAACVASTSITATFQAMVRNRGDGTADLSKITWHIVLGSRWEGFAGGPGNLETANAATVNPQVGGPLALKPGETWTGTMTITGIPKPKPGVSPDFNYAFEVLADPLNGVTESDENNNGSKVFAKNPCPK